MEHLPKEVLENVLRRLSVYDLIRVGCASKMLKALIASHSVTSSYPHISVLLLLHDDSERGVASTCRDLPTLPAWAYDADRNTWLTLSLGFLEPNLPQFAYPVASDGGLICFGSGRDFIICNPITRSWRSLPHIMQMEKQFDEDSLQAFGLKCSPNSGSYDFFLLNHCASRLPSEAILMNFNSSSSQWRVMSPLVMTGESKLHSNSIISCNSRLYTLWQMESFLSIFAVENGIWREVDVPECTSRLLKAFFMDVSGVLYMVGAVGAVWLRDNFWERPTTMRIWKLLEQNDAWVEVTRMPTSILHHFQERIDFEELQCWGKNGVLYMKSLKSDVLMFNLSTNDWKWLPELEMVVESLALVYEPSLSAMA